MFVLDGVKYSDDGWFVGWAVLLCVFGHNRNRTVEIAEGDVAVSYHATLQYDAAQFLVIVAASPFDRSEEMRFVL